MSRTSPRGPARVLIAAVGIALAGCSTAAPPASSTGPVPSTPAAASTSPTTAASAAATPDPVASLSGQIAFTDEKSAPGHAQIWVQDANGSNLRQLVVSDFDDRTPMISPDGTRVLFTRYVPDGAPLDDAGVFVVNIDGTGLRQIDTLGEDPSWSPDGTQFVETRDLFDPGADRPYSVGLWISNLDGSHRQQITRKGMRCDDTACPDGWQDNRARWSPDGKTLVFARDLYTTPEHHEIVTATVGGTRVKVLTPQSMEVDDPTWSRDGALVLFQSPPDPGNLPQHLFTVKPDGTGMHQLTPDLSADANGVSGVFHPWWSPDGGWIVFSHYPGAPGSRASLYVIKADGSGMTLLPTTAAFNANGGVWEALPAP